MSIPTQLIAVAGQTSLLPSSVPENEHAVAMRPREDEPNTEISDFTGQPALPSVDRHKQEVVWGLQDSIFMSADSDTSTKPSNLSQPPSIDPLKPRHPPKTTGTNPSASRSILSFSIDRRFIISSLLGIFAFLLYILHESSWLD